ncbi:MAG: UDP-N-acetyl-D-glucosamine 2-epimerase, UDP-hydrolysing [Comamonadaceae bacterium CG1_02_60_18]|nr:MAG: UDP-N-acetyl-D-glucosamine 2-epimerase, UDP-hydrolysing [Comamonadaceae bacterium CG1_02_60_18]PIQ55543.1 MAG: UDP-N-acetylglucosamine 2-epimerase (hydrolyzing) [Comamonadaceae bacterium CG12_big_fil_rev_8_21_14_0_65_59_15]
MKKILAITGIRSDYDLMSGLFRRLQADAGIDLRLLVGGAHMSETYGHTIDLIRRDGFTILHAIESLIDSDSLSSRLKTASIMLQGAVDAVANWEPDVIIYAGDREEVWIGAMLGTYLEVPTVHFYGGDHTETGHVDNPVRHAVSKLSTAHAVTVEEHRQRLLCMGEPASRIRVIGNISLDNFVHHQALSRQVLEKQMGLPTHITHYALVLFHPDPSEKGIAAEIFERILLALKTQGIAGCVGYPNTDPSNREIIDIIEKYRGDKNFFFYRNLDRDQFISMYKHASFIIGNSSSGILEAASIPIPAINVGLRQRGRMAGENVIFCNSDAQSIAVSIVKAISQPFLDLVTSMRNPYGDGDSAGKAYRMLKEMDLQSMRLKTEDALKLERAAKP